MNHHQVGPSAMALSEKDVVCKYVDSSSILLWRTYLQFINLNATGSSTMIGGLPLELEEITQVPSYLSSVKQ